MFYILIDITKLCNLKFFSSNSIYRRNPGGHNGRVRAGGAERWRRRPLPLFVFLEIIWYIKNSENDLKHSKQLNNWLRPRLRLLLLLLPLPLPLPKVIFIVILIVTVIVTVIVIVSHSRHRHRHSHSHSHRPAPATLL